MQVSGRAARVLSYLLADNQQCKQALLGQETPQHVDGTLSQAGLLPSIAERVCAMCSDAAGVSGGRYSIALDFGQTVPEKEELAVRCVHKMGWAALKA